MAVSIPAPAKASALYFILSTIFFCDQRISSRVHHQLPARTGINAGTPCGLSAILSAGIPCKACSPDNGKPCEIPIPMVPRADVLTKRRLDNFESITSVFTVRASLLYSEWSHQPSSGTHSAVRTRKMNSIPHNLFSPGACV